MMKLLVINGPNINLLGFREPDIYGEKTYKDLLDLLKSLEEKLKIKIDEFQSNWEGAIIDEIQKSYGVYDGIVINPAAYTHTSLAILDALKAVDIPTVEVHLSKVSSREEYRQISYIKDYVKTSIEGYGIEGYEKAIVYLLEFLGDKKLNENFNNR